MLDMTEANEIQPNNLGTWLKDERLAQGKTLNDVEQITGITIKILLAIEDSDHSRLPNYIFVRGLIRIYSGFLKLNQNMILELLEKEWGNEIKEQKPPHLKKSNIANRSCPAGCFTTLILVILALIAIIVLAYRQNIIPRQGFIPPVINKHITQKPTNRYNTISPSVFSNSPKQSTQNPSEKTLSDHK